MFRFTPIIKSKKGSKRKKKIAEIETQDTAGATNIGLLSGRMVGTCVEVDSATARELELKCCGCFEPASSRPNAIKKAGMQVPPAEGSQSPDKPIIIRLEEAFFLAYLLKVMKVDDSGNNALQWRDFLVIAEEAHPDFIDHLVAYVHLTSMGWVVKSGIKFGGHFLAYKKGPEYNHASFVVVVSSSALQKAGRDMKAIQRVAETADKDVLFLELSRPSEFELRSLSDLDLIGISETVVRRFNFSSFVQSQTFIKS